MNTQSTIEERLWDYIDGLSSAQEKQFIDEMLASNREWKEKYSELVEVHQLMLNHIQLDEPSMRFTQNVMEEIAKYQIAPATRNYLNKKIIWGIGGFFLVMLVGLFAYGFGQIQWGSSGSSNLPVDFDKVDYSKLYNNSFTNIFIMINVVLGLMLLDMYLNKKKKETNQNWGS